MDEISWNGKRLPWNILVRLDQETELIIEENLGPNRLGGDVTMFELGLVL